LKVNLDKVQAALVELRKKGLVQEKNGLWSPTTKWLKLEENNKLF